MRRMFSEKQIKEQIEKVSLETIDDAIKEEKLSEFKSGDITMEELTGISQSYGKWLVNGKELFIVLAGSIEANATLSDNTTIAEVEIPSDIIDKLYPISGDTITLQPHPFFNSAHYYIERNIALTKSSANKIYIYNNAGNYTPTQAQTFRIMFNLIVV